MTRAPAFDLLELLTMWAICCDFCFTYTTPGRDHQEVREAAALAGWTYTGEFNVCPRCARSGQ